MHSAKTAKSSLSAGKKKKGLKKKGSRLSNSSKGSRNEDHTDKPDFEAELVVAKRKNTQMEMTDRSNLFKPVSETKTKPTKKKRQDHALNQTAEENFEEDIEKNKVNETKGFDTLMAEGEG